MPKWFKAIQGVLEAAPAAGFQIAARSMPLERVASAWAQKDDGIRIVLLPGASA